MELLTFCRVAGSVKVLAAVIGAGTVVAMGVLSPSPMGTTRSLQALRVPMACRWSP